MADTPKLDMPEMTESQASKYVTHNNALRILDAIVQLNVIDKDLTTPPGSPADGATYIVGSGATGDWSGHDGEIAYYKSTGWIFAVPAEGWLAYVQDEDKHYKFGGASDMDWQEFVAGGDSYDIGFTFAGEPAGSQLFMILPMVRAVDLADDFAGSEGYAEEPPISSAGYVMTVKKNGASIGTITFDPDSISVTATFNTTGGAVSLAAGDVLSVHGPAAPDGSGGIADIGVIFKGTKG